MAAEGESSKSEDILSLEDLVKDAAASSAPPIAESVSAIDQVLSVEDPTFASELAELQKQGAIPEVDVALDSDIDKILQAEKAERATRGRARLRLWLIVRPKKKLARVLTALKGIGPWLIATAIPATKSAALTSLTAVKTGVLWLAGEIKGALNWFGRLPGRSKFLVLMVVVFAGAALAVTRVALHGSFLPSLESDFLVSFADKADQAFEIEKNEAWADLNDPLLHPEHIVLIERLIVNLKAPGDGSNPMALIDLYVEAGSKDAAVEIKDRDAEVRDMVLRTMEQLTYEELITDAGKSKLKVFLRKNLNDLMTRGRVRRVFYKSFILKP